MSPVSSATTHAVLRAVDDETQFSTSEYWDESQQRTITIILEFFPPDNTYPTGHWSQMSATPTPTPSSGTVVNNGASRGSAQAAQSISGVVGATRVSASSLARSTSDTIQTSSQFNRVQSSSVSASASLATISAVDSNSLNSSVKGSSSSTNAGVIAGAAIGGIVGLLLIGLLVFLFLFRYKLSIGITRRNKPAGLSRFAHDSTSSSSSSLSRLKAKISGPIPSDELKSPLLETLNQTRNLENEPITPGGLIAEYAQGGSPRESFFVTEEPFPEKFRFAPVKEGFQPMRA